MIIEIIQFDHLTLPDVTLMEYDISVLLALCVGNVQSSEVPQL